MLIKPYYPICLSVVLVIASCSSSNGRNTSVSSIDENASSTSVPSVETPDQDVEIVGGDRDYSKQIEIPTDINPECPKWQSGETVLVSNDVFLPENCVYERITLKVIASDVNINCNNAVFNALNVRQRNEFYNQYSLEQTPQSTGIEIISSETDGNRLQNISVSNCQLLNYVNGVTIGMNLQNSTLESLRAQSLDEQQLRDIAPSQIQLDNLKIINSHKHGVFVNRYITQLSLDNSSIKGSGNSGVYLESGSQYSTIKNSNIEGNGYSSYSRSTRTRKPRVSSKARREGLAVDGSQYNSISGNTFKGNGDGGIYLYKNCWEKYQESTQLPRLEGANDNLIKENSFVDETIGVWLAERSDRNLVNFKCGDDVLYSEFLGEYYRDYASRNIIDNNTFSESQVGIRVQDNDNSILNNRFSNMGEGDDIEIGSKIRALIGDPVVNTILDNNLLSRPDSIVYLEN